MKTLTITITYENQAAEPENDIKAGPVLCDILNEHGKPIKNIPAIERAINDELDKLIG